LLKFQSIETVAVYQNFLPMVQREAQRSRCNRCNPVERHSKAGKLVVGDLYRPL
jgi:late competence protein required for DNA uptake (superfamily II DNA/RNA helicase)